MSRFKGLFLCERTIRFERLDGVALQRRNISLGSRKAPAYLDRVEITEAQAEAFLLNQPLPAEVVAEIETQQDDPDSVLRRVSRRYAAIARRMIQDFGIAIQLSESSNDSGSAGDIE